MGSGRRSVCNSSTSSPYWNCQFGSGVMPVWSSRRPFSKYCAKYPAKNVGGEIVNLLGTSAWYAPGAAAAEMVEAILKDTKAIMPCSVYLTGEYGVKDQFLGVPVKLGKGGMEQVIQISLEPDENVALQKSAAAVKRAGAKILRGGAFKPRSSPYSFQGMGEEGLRILKQVGDDTGLATISEVMSPETVELVGRYVDILQIGARSMQNFPLLIEAGRSMKPVFLKRGPSATIDEFLLAAEYLLSQGNPNVILCERGILPLDRTYTRNTLDLAAVPVLKEHTHLPVVIDPSHGTGVARYVAPMAKAAMVAGADGAMIEMHPNPKAALSDGAQSLNPAQFSALMDDLKKLASTLNLTM